MKKYILFFIIIIFSIQNTLAGSTLLHSSEIEEEPIIPKIVASTDITIDKNKDVGEIPIQNTIMNGVVSYTVLIDIYAAPTNFQPNISLAYSSIGNNGIAGYGWNINGLSNISIANSNYYYDGENASAASLDKSSALFLDGQKLIKTNETASQIEYVTEIGHTKVISYIPSNKYYFEVLYPNGIKATLGYRTNSSNAKIIYPITKTEDNFGNYIAYTYSELNNCYYVDSIDYGNSLKSIGKVTFTYDSRKDIRPLYIAGEEVKMDKKLTKIESYHENQVLRTYNLVYTTNEYNYLSKIECLAEGKSLNPLQFFYGREQKKGGVEEDVNLQTTYRDVGPYPIVKRITSNRNRENGVLLYPNLPSYTEINKDGKDREFGSPYGWGVTYGAYYEKVSKQGNSTQQQFYINGTFHSITPADINGDGVDELVMISYARLADVPSETVHFKITNIKNDNTQYFELNFEDIFKEGKFTSPYPRFYVFGNFRGRGKAELITVNGCKTPYSADHDTKTTTSKAALIDLEDQILVKKSEIASVDYYRGRVFGMDFNGDGRTDLCVINEQGTYIYSYHNDRFNQIAYFSELKESSIDGTEHKSIMVGDLNGDGKDDIIITPKKNRYKYERLHHGTCQGCCHSGTPNSVSADGSIYTYLCAGNKYCMVEKDETKIYYSDAYDWIFYTSTGKSFKSDPKKLSIAHEGDNAYFLQDMNGDNLPDLIVKFESSVSLYLNNNGEIENYASGTQSLGPKSTIAPISNCNIKDKYSTQLLAVDKEGKVKAISFTNDKGKQQLLTKVTNSLGIETNHYYANLTEDKDIYNINDYTSSQYPYNKNFIRLNALNKSEVSYNGEIIASESYKYEDAVIDLRGLGFRGFQTITVTDSIRNTTNKLTYDPLNFDMLIESETPESYTKNIYEININENKKADIKLSSSLQKDKLKDITVTTTHSSYDSYGNPKTIVTDYGNGIKNTVTKEYNNHVTETIYKLGEVSQEIIKKERNNKSVSLRADYDYYENRLPKSKKTYYNNNLTGEEQSFYDDYGRHIKSQAKTYSSKWLTKNYKYDDYGRLKEQTDPLGLTTSYFYNTKGQLYLTKNHKGHETKCEFDSWGRKVKTIYPDGTFENIKTQWVGANQNSTGGNQSDHSHDIELDKDNLTSGSLTACNSISLLPGFSFSAAKSGSLNLKVEPAQCIAPPSHSTDGCLPAIYMTLSTNSAGQAVQTYYDVLGREVRTGKLRFDGKYLYADKVYNKRGLVEKESLPFKGLKPALWNTYSYDPYDRVTSLTLASGKKNTYTYNKNTITSTLDSIQRTNIYDATGQLISVTDPAGMITYNLRPDDQPETIQSPGSVTTSFEYDIYGRQIALNDPSAGTKRFEYDNAGNISKETDANGNVVKIIYDDYGRTTQKEIIGNQSVTYTYNTDGLPVSEISTNGTSREYTYDNLFRLKTEKETGANGKWLQKAYTYSGANITTKAYVSNTGNIATEYFTYQLGHLSEIKLNGSNLIWKLNEENGMGIPVKATTGILQRTYGYDNYGIPVSRQIKKDNSFIQNFSYNFNVATGNLNWRKDNTRNFHEDFGYDNLNRLTSFDNVTIKYDVKGNITDHSEIGKFEYNVKKPFAVEAITPYGNSIPLRNQQIRYNALMRPDSIAENGYIALLTYNTNGERVKTRIIKDNKEYLTRYYLGGQYEIETGVDGAKEKLYLGGDAYSASAVLVKEGIGSWNVYYIGRDYQGNITHIINSSGSLKEELSYDPWGRLRNPANHNLYSAEAQPTLFLGRGYTGHEHLAMFGLINMNARLYDPVLGRFLSPDPYVQSPTFSQNFNRYSYAVNNPLRYNDPSGEFLWAPLIIGAALGAYSGGVLANDGNFNPTKWDWNAGKTWGHMLGGAIVGGASGYLGASIAASGMPMANTAGMMVGSFSNSIGMNLITNGSVPISMNFGVTSFDFSNGNWGFLGEGGNSFIDNLGYFMGAMANISDILAGYKPTTAKLATENDPNFRPDLGIGDPIGHSQLGIGNEVLIDWGPGPYGEAGGFFNSPKGTNFYKKGSYTPNLKGGKFWDHQPVFGVNEKTIRWFSGVLNKGGDYQLLVNSCVSQTSRALNISGVFNIGIHPYLLHSQMYLRNIGVRPLLFLHYTHLNKVK